MMIITKVFRLESSDETSVQVGVIENIQADSLLFTWDSSLLLSAYIVSNKHLFDNASILEIGAGSSTAPVTCPHTHSASSASTYASTLLSAATTA